MIKGLRKQIIDDQKESEQNGWYKETERLGWSLTM